MARVRWLDSPFAWAVAGFAIGLGLGVTQVSAWLVAAGLGLFVLYLRLHGLPMPRKSEEEAEGAEAVSAAPGQREASETTEEGLLSRLVGPVSTQAGRREISEGWLFAGGPAFILGWIVGFVVHGLIF